MKIKLTAEMQLLSDISKVFSESLDLELTLRSILKSLDTYLKLQRGTITLLDQQTETINVEIAHGLSTESAKKASYKIGEGVTGAVVQTGTEIVVPDISKDPRFLHKTGSRIQPKGKKLAFFCVPIKLEGSTISALSVDKEAARDEDFEANVSLLNIIATLVAQAVKLNKLVETDRNWLHDENISLGKELKSHFNIHNMVGSSNAMKQIAVCFDQLVQLYRLCDKG